MKRVVLAVSVAGLLLCGCRLIDALRGVAPATSTEPLGATRSEQLLGTWHTRQHVIQFSRDGTYRAAVNAEKLRSDPPVQGSYWFEDGQFVVKDRQAGQGCFWGEIGRYEVTVLARGYLIFEPLVDECLGRRIILERSIWLWGPAEA